MVINKKKAANAARRRENQRERERREKERSLAEWVPETALGKSVIAGELQSYEDVVRTGKPVLEPQITDTLLPDLEEKLMEFRKTTRVTRQGRNFSFRASVLVGNKNGWIGLGTAKDKERWPAIQKATARAKKQLVRVNRGAGSWESADNAGKNSIPFKVEGKCSSVRVTLLPAPDGTGLVAGNNIKDVLRFAGITDVWSKTRGSSATKLNFVKAAIDALSKTASFRASDELREKTARSERA